MESNVRDYIKEMDKLKNEYSESEDVYKAYSAVESNLNKHKEQRDEYDPNSPRIVCEKALEYIEEEKEQNENEITEKYNSEIKKAAPFNDRIDKNVNLIMSQLGEDYTNDYFHANKASSYVPLNESTVTSDKTFLGLYNLNKLFSYIFRFKFLTMIPQIFRTLTGILVWFILLESVICIRGFFWVIFLPAINILVYMGVKSSAKKYLKDNSLMYMALYFQDDFYVLLHNYYVKVFNDEKVSKWMSELEDVKKSGVGIIRYDLGGVPSMAAKARDYCQKEYDELSETINKEQAEFDQFSNEYYDILNTIKSNSVKLNSSRSKIIALNTNDEKHNNAVITDYVSLGFNYRQIYFAQELVAYKHQMKPLLFSYLHGQIFAGEEFRTDLAEIVERFMIGFFQENSRNIIDMTLVDFEGLYFPPSRSKNFLKVLTKETELDNLFKELDQQRMNVGNVGNGKISSINPQKVKENEKPFKYKIVIFIGVDLSNLDRENTQLFINGENFGFLPIIFMDKDMINNIADDKPFIKVIRDIDDVYNYEYIPGSLKYNFLLSNNPDEFNKRGFWIDKTISYEEFYNEYCEKIKNTDESELPILIAVDVDGLKEDYFDAIDELSTTPDFNVIFYTVSGKVPEYVSAAVIDISNDINN